MNTQERHFSVATNTPNAATIKTIKDVREGKTFKASSVDDVLTQCLDV